MGIVVIVLVLAGAGLGAVLVLALRPARLVAAVPTGQRLDSAAAQIPGGFTRPTTVPAASAPPIEVAVPVIGVRSRLIGLRLNNDGSLQVPTDYGIAGWYSDGPAPGDRGHPAVIVGHVDSHSGPGIFYRLPQLRTGDSILIRRADGTDLRFVVYQSAVYAKDAFPAKTVYAPRRSPEIRLITCTGTFSKSSGHYTSNRVVFARLAPVAPPPPTR